MSATAPVAPPPPASSPAKQPVKVPPRVWQSIAITAATFTLIVAAVMVVRYRRAIAEDPIGARELADLRQKLHAQPKDEAIKARIREVDLRERQRYFAHTQRNAVGGWLLLAGGVAFILSASQYYASRARLPQPRRLATADEVERDASRARIAVFGTAIAAAGALAIIGIAKPVRLGVKPESGTAATPLVRRPALSPDMLRANWPRFRGADGLGVALYTNIPITWNLDTGENIGWKMPLPLAGHSSPVLWGGKLFLTGSSKTAREIFCFDAATGAIQWRLPVTLVPEAAVAAMEIPELSGSTSASPACDDQRVFAIFATGELVAADHNGKLVWSKNLGKLDNGYGHATSLLIWRDRLILQLDQGHDGEAAKSRLYAFDPATGEIIWQQKRALPASWGTPVIINAAQTEQIVCLGEPWLISYNFADGKELWRYNGLGSDLTPSPIFSEGLVIAISPSQRLIAIRPDGVGDITQSHVAWMVEENVPDIASPVSTGELLFTMETSGNLVCRETKTGKKLWEHAWDAEFQASPAASGGRLYLSTTDGSTHVIEAAREFKELAHNKLGEPFRASPVFADGRMYLRGATNLFCITAKGATK